MRKALHTVEKTIFRLPGTATVEEVRNLKQLADVNPQGDEKLAKAIEQQHKYFEKHGMKPLWFVEMKEHAPV